MKPFTVITDHTMQELTAHGTSEFPIMISSGHTYRPDMGVIPWHWHTNLELTYLEWGHLDFSVGTDSCILNPGEAILINSRVLHQIKPCPGEEALYYSYVFSHELISDSVESLVSTKYLIPFMRNQNVPFHIFHPGIQKECEALSQIHLLNRAASTESFVREFRIQHQLQAVLIAYFQAFPEVCAEINQAMDRDNHQIMKILLFLRAHYGETITLTDLAAEANISKSSCNRLFHKTLKMTPFEYLLTLRIDQSKRLLADTTKSVTEIAYACGFHDISYYCKVFRRVSKKTPEEYRRGQGI